MEKFLKRVFYLSLTILSIYSIIGLINILFPIEIINENLEDNYITSRFFIVPITIMLTLTGTILKNDNGNLVAVKVFSTVIVSALSVYFLIICLFAGLCTWTTNSELYIHKFNKNTKIVVRSMGCGAVDSSPDIYKTFKTIEIANFLSYISEIDTNKIDKSEWIRSDLKTYWIDKK